jgi:hypothetical protein
MKTIFALAPFSFAMIMSATSTLFGNTLKEKEPPAVTIDLGVPHDDAGLATGIQKLAAGVGWEFDPDAETTEGLRRIGINAVRCINVDVRDGGYLPDGSYKFPERPARLAAHLETCRQLKARPHLIIGQAAPKELTISAEDAKERLFIMGQTPGKRAYWNGDWEKLHAYWKALYHYVLIERKFPDARFEVGNEPDIDGQFPRLIGKEGPMGSRALYDSYFGIYESAAKAAAEFEAENPGVQVRLGGPALAWAYSFKFGELNWLQTFLKDCAERRLKLDFIGIHFYGNISSLNGEYPSSFPSFQQMLDQTKAWRDETFPRIPIIFSEWGPSYHVNDSPESLVNADQVGAAWSLEFLTTLRRNGLEEALFLVTTDLKRKTPAAMGENGWGWASLFVNPRVFDTAWPKPLYHVFDMVSRLGERAVRVEGLPDDVRAIATVDDEAREVRVLFWNFRAVLPELQPAIDKSDKVEVKVALAAAAAEFFGAGKPVRIERFEVSKEHSNALTEYMADKRVTEKSRLQTLDDRMLDSPVQLVCFELPPSGVTLLTWKVSANP